MANLKITNRKIKARFPDLDIEVVRGDGYIYFDGNDGFDKIPSIMVNPTTIDTDSLVVMCIDDITNYINTNRSEK